MLGDLQHVPRLLRTVRYLRLRQIVWRLWQAARFRVYVVFPPAAESGTPAVASLAAPGLAALERWAAQKFVGSPSPRHLQLASEAMRWRFTFLNRSLEMPHGQVDWCPPGASRLWQYHLHYGEDVIALARVGGDTADPAMAERAWDLVEQWIYGNRPGHRPGWEPYPLSLRVVNWAMALALLPERGRGGGRRSRLALSLATQGRFLARHVEYHLGGNHLIKNAKALLVLGVLLEGSEGARWKRWGRELLQTELARQILPDGGHVERSPLYHCIVLEDVLDCLAITAAGVSVPPTDNGVHADADEVQALGSIADRMAGWLAAMLHPDGTLPLFNDCVRTRDPSPAALLAYAGRLGRPAPEPRSGSVSLSSSGYYVLARGRGRMVIDCGEIGPDELPAHAHADTLSYELLWDGHAVVVDSGTSEYALDPVRRYVRSTAAHNTVVVDGLDQSEVWASHRVGRRARPCGARLHDADGVTLFSGAHDGYRWRGVVHQRHVVTLADAWIVVDELLGRGRHRAESYVHLHPAVTIRPHLGGGWLLEGPGGTLRIEPVGSLEADASRSWYCSDWNRMDPAPLLRFTREGEVPLIFGYVLAPAELPVRVDVSANQGGVTIAGEVGPRAFRVTSERCTFSC